MYLLHRAGWMNTEGNLFRDYADARSACLMVDEEQVPSCRSTRPLPRVMADVEERPEPSRGACAV
jgi:hypothetical protein